MAQTQLIDIYHALLERFGPQHWWPGETEFEMMVGAVLTQNTNWGNVEKALTNLKNAGLLTADKIDKLPPQRLAELVKPAGYFNIKAKRLKNLIHWLCATYDGNLDNLRPLSVDRLREELLSINGVGRETADSIILYALKKPTFVVDAYTHRILSRHHLIDREAGYEDIKEFCQSHLPEDVQLYNEFHALIVKLGKTYCKTRPQCPGCPLEGTPHTVEADEF